MKLRLLALTIAVGGSALFAGCGSKSDTLAMSGSAKNFTMDPKYKEFCGAYDTLNLSLDALAKEGSSKAAFADVLAKSKQLVDIAPADVQAAVASNDAAAMNRPTQTIPNQTEVINTTKPARKMKLRTARRRRGSQFMNAPRAWT